MDQYKSVTNLRIYSAHQQGLDNWLLNQWCCDIGHLDICQTINIIQTKIYRIWTKLILFGWRLGFTPLEHKGQELRAAKDLDVAQIFCIGLQLLSCKSVFELSFQGYLMVVLHIHNIRICDILLANAHQVFAPLLFPSFCLKPSNEHPNPIRI